jgi:sortase A
MSPFKLISSLFIIGGIIILTAIFLPVIKVEISYLSDQMGSVRYVVEGDEQYNTFVRTLMPANTEFSIVIPKIAAVAPIIANVDSQNKEIYLAALSKGVAQAKGTAFPGDPGNVYLFAHSTDAFYNVNTYNAVFFLIGKLTKGDAIYVYYKDRRFKYVVDQVKIVNPNEVNYLAGDPNQNTLTLQTCYPPGTAFKRLIVIANEIGIE